MAKLCGMLFFWRANTPKEQQKLNVNFYVNLTAKKKRNVRARHIKIYDN